MSPLVYSYITGRFDGFLSLHSVAVISTMTKSNLGEKKVYSSLQFIVDQEEEDRQEVKAGTPEATEECCFLARSLLDCSVCFVIHPGTTHNELALPYQSLVEEMLNGLTYRSVFWDHFLI